MSDPNKKPKSESRVPAQQTDSTGELTAEQLERTTGGMKSLMEEEGIYLRGKKKKVSNVTIGNNFEEIKR